MPTLSLMVTGGVEPNRENLAAWIKSGVSCVGMGANFIPAEAIANSDWGIISKLCSDSLQFIKKPRN